MNIMILFFLPLGAMLVNGPELLKSHLQPLHKFQVICEI